MHSANHILRKMLDKYNYLPLKVSHLHYECTTHTINIENDGLPFLLTGCDLQPASVQFTRKIGRVRQNETLTSVRHAQTPLATIGANVSYNLRNPNNLQTLQYRSQLYYKSFLPGAIRTWNCLPEDTRNANTTASLKYKLNRDLNCPPKYYNEGNRLAQIFHSRLRTNCSALSQHLHSKSIVPSPLCIRGLSKKFVEFLHNFCI